MLRELYRRGVLLIGWTLTLIYVRRYEAEGRGNVPRDGGVIVASNHLNNADPPMIARALRPRYPIFMAKKEMIGKPIVGPLFRAWGAFPVRRGEADLSALRAATELVRRGEMLLMFPEGTRSRTGTLQRGHPGTAMIAMRTGAPVLPVAVYGTEHIKWPAFFLRPRSVRRIRVVIGEPFTLSGYTRINGETAQAATDEIMRRIAALLPPEYRGAYAGADDGAPTSGVTADATATTA